MNNGNNQKLYNFFKNHIESVAKTSTNDFYTRYVWKESIDPIVEISDVLSVESEALKNAMSNYEEAQKLLVLTRDAQILKLRKLDYFDEAKEKNT